MSQLSVVIVNYNTRADLQACLASLAGDVTQPQIIVVDNASTDGSADMARAEFPRVTLVEPGHNTWFCGGNNLGIEAATGDYVLLLNPDTVVPPTALTELVVFLDEHPDYAGATMQMRYPDGTIQRTCSRVPSYKYLLANHTPLGWLRGRWRHRLNDWHWYGTWHRDEERDVEVPPGSCLLMRRADLRLNEALLLYFPEDDLAQRFYGRKFRYLVGSPITHKEKGSTRTWTATAIYFRDLLVYTRQYHGRARAALLWLLSRPLWLALWLRRNRG